MTVVPVPTITNQVATTSVQIRKKRVISETD
jgi:hypothetical protein